MKSLKLFSLVALTLLACSGAWAQEADAAPDEIGSSDDRAPAPGMEADPVEAAPPPVEEAAPPPREEKAPPARAERRDRGDDGYDDDYDEDYDEPRRGRRDRNDGERRRRDSDFEELDFFDVHVTFSLNDDLEPEIEENLMMMWIMPLVMTVIIPAFGLTWGPMVFAGGPNPGSDYWIDVIVHYLGFTVYNSCSSICLPLSLFNILYLAPVQFINMYDYHLKKGRAEGKFAAQKRAPPPVRTVDSGFAY